MYKYEEIRIATPAGVFVQREENGVLIAEWKNYKPNKNMEIIIIETPKATFKPIVQYKQQPVYFFRFDCEETADETIRCNETTITMKGATYEKMVAACIEVKYSIDAQLALLYNYQLSPADYQQQMEDYQTWRAYCKESCRNFFGAASPE